jgi:hypothetical protein
MNRDQISIKTKSRKFRGAAAGSVAGATWDFGDFNYSSSNILERINRDKHMFTLAENKDTKTRRRNSGSPKLISKAVKTDSDIPVNILPM